MCTGCCCCCARRPRKDRVSPHGLIYRDFPHFVNQDGNYLFCRYWEPVTPPRALVMIIHGAGEHSGRYMNVASMLVRESYIAFAHDHIGHGQSEGKRLSVPNFRTYVRDCLQHIDMVKQRYPRLPLFLLAQGLGGLVATYVGKERQHEIAGVIFMAPLVLVNPESATPLKEGFGDFGEGAEEIYHNAVRFRGHELKAELCCARMMYHLMPNFSLGYMDPRWLSRSQREVINYMNDPLNYLGPFRMRFIVQVLHAVTKLDKIFPEITWPVLILHGDSDKLCDIKGSFLMYEQLGSSDKTFKVFPHAFHHLHKETPRVVGEVTMLIRKWLKERIPKQQTV